MMEQVILEMSWNLMEEWIEDSSSKELEGEDEVTGFLEK